MGNAYKTSLDTRDVESPLAQINSSSDLYDQAYAWGWNNPQFRELVYLCYKTPNYRENALRFYYSGEFTSAISLLSMLGKKPSPNVTVLDFACGNGIATYALARAGYSVVGSDSSLGLLAGLNAANQLVGQDGVQFQLKHSTGESFDFPSNSFDVVWIREALHHMKDLGGFLTDVSRILKPGGVVVCMREIVIWNDIQRANYLKNHPFYHITHDEGCYLLEEYYRGFAAAKLALEVTLAPTETPINTYPDLFVPGTSYNFSETKANPNGYSLFTFVGRKSV